MNVLGNWPAALAAGIFFVSTTGLADTTLEPKPAELMPKAAQAILNDVVATKDGYVAVGDRGHILHSSDGLGWTQKKAPVQAMLNRVRFLDGMRGWAVGHDATVLETRDGGMSWRLIHHDSEWGKPMYDVLFLDQNRGFLIGANSAFKMTRDGGQSWALQEPDFTFPGVHLNTILQLADGTIVISGEKGMMARSRDQGESWTQLKTPYAGSFFGMLPRGESGVFVFGLRGNVYSVEDVKALEIQDSMEWDEFSLETVTDNAQLATSGWRYYANGLKESLFGGVVLGASDVLLVGVNGAVVRSDDGRMRRIKTDIDYTLGSALVSRQGLVTVGLLGVQTVPFAP